MSDIRPGKKLNVARQPRPIRQPPKFWMLYKNIFANRDCSITPDGGVSIRARGTK